MNELCNLISYGGTCHHDLHPAKECTVAGKDHFSTARLHISLVDEAEKVFWRGTDCSIAVQARLILCAKNNISFIQQSRCPSLVFSLWDLRVQERYALTPTDPPYHF